LPISGAVDGSVNPVNEQRSWLFSLRQ